MFRFMPSSTTAAASRALAVVSIVTFYSAVLYFLAHLFAKYTGRLSTWLRATCATAVAIASVLLVPLASLLPVLTAQGVCSVVQECGGYPHALYVASKFPHLSQAVLATPLLIALFALAVARVPHNPTPIPQNAL